MWYNKCEVILFEVTCEGDSLTLTKTTPPEEKSKKSLEEKIKELDKKKKKKLAEIIEKH